MKTIKFLFCLFICIGLLSACKEPLPKGAYSVDFNETITFENNAQVTFTTVLQDSRCPTNFMCIDEGEALVAITVVTDDGAHYPQLKLRNSDPTAATITIGKKEITLLKVLPFPDGSDIDHNKYSIQFEVK